MHNAQRPRRFRRRGWIVLAASLAAVILIGATGATVTSLHSAAGSSNPSANGTAIFAPTATPTIVAPPGSTIALPPPSPISGPASKDTPPRLSANTGILYTVGNVVYLLTNNSIPEALNMPGYNPFIAPILTSDGRLLYAGDGLYLADPLSRDAAPPLQIAKINTATQVIASIAISADGKQVYWSVEPHNGVGKSMLYEATLTATGASTPTLLYSKQAGDCPCYLIFGIGPTSTEGTPTLLLSDDLGTPTGQGTGLWIFDVAHQQVGPELLADNQGQAPLILSSDGARLAYGLTTGEVPEPTDGSVPLQIGSLPYANSMAVTGWNGTALGTPTIIVPPQANVPTFSSYHWITTPIFSPDNQSIAYIQFSSDDKSPYDRHSSLYITGINGQSAPRVIANFSARLVELGGWLDDHTLLFYADDGIYALDTQTTAFSLLATTTDYSSIIGPIHLLETVPGNQQCYPQCAQSQHSSFAASPGRGHEPLSSALNRAGALAGTDPQPFVHLPPPFPLAVSPARVNIRGSPRGQQ